MAAGRSAGSSSESLTLVGMAGEPVDHARQRGGHGVEAGEHEQEGDVDDVFAGERLAVDLGGDEPADQVVARLAARFPAIELGVEVLDHLRVGGDAVVVVGRVG